MEYTVTIEVPDDDVVNVSFDERSSNYYPDRDINLLFLSGVQAHLNRKLQARGCVFLNEVFETLGLPRTRAGQLIGWTDGFIDLGIIHLNPTNEADRTDVLLFIKTQGLIIDAI